MLAGIGDVVDVSHVIVESTDVGEEVLVGKKSSTFVMKMIVAQSAPQKYYRLSPV
jgi:hypothetical protein